MYKALNYWVFGGFGPNKTPYEFIDYAAAKGLDGVEMTIGDCLDIETDEATCRAIAAYAKEKGVGLRTLATGCYGAMSLGAADEDERQRAIAFTKKYLQLAAWLGAESVLVIPASTTVSWDPSRPVVPYAIAWENSIMTALVFLPQVASITLPASFAS